MSEQPLYEKILFTEEEVDVRINEMAAEITERYNGSTALFVSLLNGAQPFTAKLMSAIWRHDPYFHPNVQSMIVSRYGPNREPGETRIVTDLPPGYRDLTGRHVILLDDLVDGGGTLEFAANHLLGYGAEKVDKVVLVKKQKQSIGTEVTMFGFETPDTWLTGMGMDDERIASEGNRWAGWIAAANS
jgi:hypoxanthine phosphoribosyltransferase